jgi:hypothetical protein
MSELPPPPPGVDPERYQLSIDFMNACYKVFDVHLTAVSGLHGMGIRLSEFQDKLVAKMKTTDPQLASIEFLDTQTVDHKLEAGDGEQERLLFRTTQGEMKINTAPFGPFERFLGRMAVTFLYATWEDRFRGKFATLIGFSEKSELKDDLFGDLGLLRNACVHNHGIATTKVAEKSKILRWYKEGQEIVISIQHVDTLVDEIDHFCARFCDIERNVPSLRDNLKTGA